MSKGQPMPYHLDDEPGLRWTSEKPKVPGWYWWRNLPYTKQMVVEVHGWPNPKAGLSFYVPDVNKSIDVTLGQWAGPLEPPSTDGKER